VLRFIVVQAVVRDYFYPLKEDHSYAACEIFVLQNLSLQLLSFIFQYVQLLKLLKSVIILCECLQDLVSFLEPLLRNSSEHRRNYMVIKNLILRANLEVSLMSCSLVAFFWACPWGMQHVSY
jgi:hypothetical protein